MMDSALALFLLTGAFAGVIAGLLGVGGGLIIVPVLVSVFLAQGIAEQVAVHLAIGTSLATIIATALSSMYSHHRHGAVKWDAFARLTPGIVVGAWLGALAADQLASQALRWIFGVFELAVAAQMALALRPAAHRSLPRAAGLSAVGGIIGFVSAIVGIGGGTLTVPFLLWCNVGLRAAVATSSACGFPIAVAGAAGFAFVGMSAASLPSGASGFIYWPALVPVALASVLTAPLGAWLAHRLPVDLLRRFFALFLAVLGIRMLSGF